MRHTLQYTHTFCYSFLVFYIMVNQLYAFYVYLRLYKCTKTKMFYPWGKGRAIETFHNMCVRGECVRVLFLLAQYKRRDTGVCVCLCNGSFILLGDMEVKLCPNDLFAFFGAISTATAVAQRLPVYILCRRRHHRLLPTRRRST